MFKNYLKVAFRNIVRSKLTSFINITGLALALASCLLIYLYVIDETSYDQHHVKADRIYRITRDFISADGVTNLRLGNVAPPIGPLIKVDYGEVEVMARSINFGLVIGMEENGELTKNFSEDFLFIAEPDILKIFDIEIIAGDHATPLDRPFTIMLSERSAKKFFTNGENPIGRRLRAGGRFDVEITGVYKDFPPQSHFHPEYLVSFSTMDDDNIYGRTRLETNWGNNAFGTYILLREGSDPTQLENQLPEFINKHFGPFAIANGAPADFDASKRTKLHVQKVSDIHLHSHLDDELEVDGNINNIYMISVIGLFIILIACFNFINLSTARATMRTKEVGLRKVVGALRNQLVSQYLSESVLIAFLAMVFAFVFTQIGLGWLNMFTGKSLEFNFADVQLILGVIGFVLMLGLLAGIYPAFVVSSYKPALTLKGKSASQGKGYIRKVLVVAQFAISIVLIIATVVTMQQLQYLNNQHLGYEKDQVISIPHYRELGATYDAFYQQMVSSSTVKNAARSSRVPTGRLLDSSGTPQVAMGDSVVLTNVVLKMISTDHEFFNTYAIGVAAGRTFSKEIPSDDSLAFVINEAAAREIGWENQHDGVGKEFSYGGTTGQLIGIVKDFHFESLHQRIIPMVFFANTSNRYSAVSIKIASADMKQGIAHVEKVWKEFLPGRPFEYEFISDNYKDLYKAEQDQNQLFIIFALLAIFIACLGLFGLATHNTLLRIKEIGIRKVLGANILSVLGLLSREIVILIIVANLVAWPVAWYFLDAWLSSFAYHIEINLLVFFLAAVIALFIALITVSTQTIKAAVSNPVNALRYE